MPRWSTETRSEPSVFAELRDWWDAQLAVKNNPFLSTEILGCWENGFDEPGSKLNVLFLRRDGDVVAALPLYRAKGRLRSMSRAHSEPFDVICIDDEDVRQRVPAWLDARPIVYLYRVSEASLLMGVRPERPRWLVQTTFNTPYVELDAGMATVRAGMSKDFQRTLRRRRRRLEEMGSLTLVEHKTSADSEGLLAEGLRLEASGWKGQRGQCDLE